MEYDGKSVSVIVIWGGGLFLTPKTGKEVQLGGLQTLTGKLSPPPQPPLPRQFPHCQSSAFGSCCTSVSSLHGLMHGCPLAFCRETSDAASARRLLLSRSVSLGGCVSYTFVIVSKQLNVRPQLLWNANRKPYRSCRMVSISTTLTDA